MLLSSYIRINCSPTSYQCVAIPQLINKNAKRDKQAMWPLNSDVNLTTLLPETFLYLTTFKSVDITLIMRFPDPVGKSASWKYTVAGYLDITWFMSWCNTTDPNVKLSINIGIDIFVHHDTFGFPPKIMIRWNCKCFSPKKYINKLVRFCFIRFF